MTKHDILWIDPTHPKNLDNPLFDIQIDALTMLAIIANVDLAIKHPSNVGPTSILARNAARQMALYLHQHTALLFPELIEQYKKSGILPDNVENIWQPS